MLKNWKQFNESVEIDIPDLDDIDKNYIVDLVKRSDRKHSYLWSNAHSDYSHKLQSVFQLVCGYKESDRLTEMIFHYEPKFLIKCIMGSVHQNFDTPEDRLNYINHLKELEYILSFPTKNYKLCSELEDYIKDNIVEDCDDYMIKYSRTDVHSYLIPPHSPDWFKKEQKCVYRFGLKYKNHEDIEGIKEYIMSYNDYLSDLGVYIEDISFEKPFKLISLKLIEIDN